MAIPVSTIRRALLALLAGYWLLLFLATHVPRIPAAVQLPGSDKWHHFAAYAGLSFLLTAYVAAGKPLTWKRAAGVVIVAVLYGGLDELLQIPVGRDAEFADWFADIGGAAIGATAFVAGRAVLFSRVCRALRRRNTGG